MRLSLVVLDFSKLEWKGPGYLGQTRGNMGQVRVSVSFQNKSYEVILKYICGTVMILNLQFKIKTVKK